jgi:hypothetical protein
MSEPPDITLSPEAMRELGYRIVDMLVEHQATLAEGRAVTVGDAEALEAALAEPIPETGEEPGRLLEQLQREVFANMAHLDHPRFFGFVPSPGNFVGAMADALASGFNVFAGTWLGGSGPAEIERVTVDWLRQAVGFPEEAGGLFVSGGSVANITALAVARQRRLGGHDPSARIYYSDQTHSSIARGLKVLGFAEDQLVVLPTGGDCRLSLAALEVQIARDKAAGKRPFCVVANAGTTSTGAIDPLAALAALCRREQLWLHADGAYGAAAVLSGRGRTALRDSIRSIRCPSTRTSGCSSPSRRAVCWCARRAGSARPSIPCRPTWRIPRPSTARSISASTASSSPARSARSSSGFRSRSLGARHLRGRSSADLRWRSWPSERSRRRLNGRL